MRCFWFTDNETEKLWNIARLTLSMLGAVEPQQWFVEWVWGLGLELGLGPFLPPFSPLSAPPLPLIPLQPALSCTSLPLTPLCSVVVVIVTTNRNWTIEQCFVFLLFLKANINIKVQYSCKLSSSYGQLESIAWWGADNKYLRHCESQFKIFIFWSEGGVDFNFFCKLLSTFPFFFFSFWIYS